MKKKVFPLEFKETGRGITVKYGDSLEYYAISRDGRNFRLAKARIEGEKVVIWHEDIEDPVTERYPWADNPDYSNLYNDKELPASPFELRKNKKYFQRSSIEFIYHC